MQHSKLANHGKIYFTPAEGVSLKDNEHHYTVPVGTTQCDEAYNLAKNCLGQDLIPGASYEVPDEKLNIALDRFKTLAAEANSTIH